MKIQTYIAVILGLIFLFALGSIRTQNPFPPWVAAQDRVIYDDPILNKAVGIAYDMGLRSEPNILFAEHMTVGTFRPLKKRLQYNPTFADDLPIFVVSIEGDFLFMNWHSFPTPGTRVDPHYEGKGLTMVFEVEKGRMIFEYRQPEYNIASVMTRTDLALWPLPKPATQSIVAPMLYPGSAMVAYQDIASPVFIPADASWNPRHQNQIPTSAVTPEVTAEPAIPSVDGG